MANDVLAGIVAGAVGTNALTAVTCGNMVLGDCPASTAPMKIAAILADKAGIDLAHGGKEAEERLRDQEYAGHNRQAEGAWPRHLGAATR